MKRASLHAPADEIGEIFENSPQNLIPLLDDVGRYAGYCARRDKFMKLRAEERTPIPRVGGLATPLGVYLTTGVHAAGAGLPGLALTGISLALFVMGIRYGFYSLASSFDGIQRMNDTAQIAVAFGLLLAIIRLSPMAGLHAAEHQIIHLLENGLPLTPENACRQPRTHRRCGTGIAVGLIGLEIALIGAFQIQPVALAIAISALWAILFLMGWPHIGLFIQSLLTTKRPNPGQIRNAIRAGGSLLEMYRSEPHGNPPLWQRIWNSGMVPILISFLLTSWLFEQALLIQIRFI